MPENASVPVSQPTIDQPLTGPGATEPTRQLVNKNFWRFIIVFLILLPLITAVGIFGYQVYLTRTLSSQSLQTNTPVIDPRLVVTPDLLPSASSSGEIPSGWKKFTNSIAGYSFGYPQDWTVVEGENNEIILRSPNLNAGSFNFEAIAAEQVSNSTTLANFINNQDKQSPLRINVATQSATTTVSGLPLIIRYITKGSETTQVPEAYVALDKNVLHVSAEGELASNNVIFNQLIRTITAASNQPISSNEWTNYQNSFGYSLKYPNSVSLKSNDRNNIDPSNLEKSTSIILFPIAEIQNTTGFSNSLDFQLSDREPPQSATLSATRDFGSREFKAYETTGQIHYVGQLSSGNWLQIAFTHNSNIENRTLLNQVLDTVTLKEQLP